MAHHASRTCSTLLGLLMRPDALIFWPRLKDQHHSSIAVKPCGVNPLNVPVPQKPCAFCAWGPNTLESCSCSAALVYGAKHGGFTSLRELPGLLGSSGHRSGPAASASPGLAGANSQLPSLGRDGFATLTASCGAPSAAYGPIGGPPPPKAPGGLSILSATQRVQPTVDGINGAMTGCGGRPRTPPALPPLQTKRSNRCVTVTAQPWPTSLQNHPWSATCQCKDFVYVNRRAAHSAASLSAPVLAGPPAASRICCAVWHGSALHTGVLSVPIICVLRSDKQYVPAQ